ncbi:MAG: hypothetical protein LBE56_12005 [Tannerella sp.]|jgi:hypothetical protein|nr:hypothetical protein [Tannerella sp.]
MEVKQNQLDDLKGKNPFKAPNGYFEGLTAQIMSQIPDDTTQNTKVISMNDKMRPWLFIAAACAGLLLVFRLLISPAQNDSIKPDDASMQFQALVSGELLQDISEDDLDYLEYLENQSLDRELVEEIDNME